MIRKSLKATKLLFRHIMLRYLPQLYPLYWALLRAFIGQSGSYRQSISLEIGKVCFESSDEYVSSDES